MVDSNTRIPTPAAMVDSLSAYEFQVQLDGQIVNGIFSVHGLTSFTLEGDRPPLLITKMVQRDPNTPFNRWIRETQQAARANVPPPAQPNLIPKLPAKDLVIIAMDEGTATRRWVYQNAYISQVSYSDFNTALSELVEERILIRAASVAEEWL